MLSILIPTYNDDCRTLVKTLANQAQRAALAGWEIIVADDGSTDADVVTRNASIQTLPGCRFVRNEKNMGRAAIRNFLVAQAAGDRLLFVDADMHVSRADYLQRYAEAFALGDVVYGGYDIEGGTRENLRFVYEDHGKKNHSAQMRNQHPYSDFHTSNFMVARQVMLAIPFDERFRYYGYEDVFFGKQLQTHGVSIVHIDNPVAFRDFETNANFLSKSKEGVRTLRVFRKELKGFSPLLTLAEKLQRMYLKSLITCVFRLLEKAMLHNLYSTRPSLFIFQFYKLGYYLTLD